MSNRTNSPACERSSDLMAFLYDEMNTSETREFEAHLRDCQTCRDEASSFGMVRESIVRWRDEVLTGFVPTATPAKKSALAAFRQFFDLSPLWLKGAAAFAVLVFCVLVVLLFVTFKKEETTIAKSGAVYTQEEVKQLIDDALAKQKITPVVDQSPQTFAAVNPPAPAPPSKPAPKQTARNRRPLSRAEREQLAADLRLLPTDDDLDLLGDRINYEEKR